MEMEIVRKLSGSSSGQSSPRSGREKLSKQRNLQPASAIDEDASTATSPLQDRALTLMHLRKLFADFSRTPMNSSETEQKLYRMLPLFVKVRLIDRLID